MAYVKKIVKYHKGEISVISEIGKGSTFEIKLPINIRKFCDLKPAYGEIFKERDSESLIRAILKASEEAVNTYGDLDKHSYEERTNAILQFIARPEGLEPPTYRLGICRSILMSYGTTNRDYKYTY